jgi:hypothetical protein
MPPPVGALPSLPGVTLGPQRLYEPSPDEPPAPAAPDAPNGQGAPAASPK